VTNGPIVLYWDIDGTLLSTARAGVPALEDAAEQVLGVRPDLSRMATAGLTDGMIARRILLDAGHRTDIQREAELLRAYGQALPSRLTERRGKVLPGIVETLDSLSLRDDVVNVLVTGNIRIGAAAKLESYGLDHHFDLGGFSEDGHARADIARAAVDRATERYGASARAGTLIGDTPYDVRAGHATGLRVIAVCSDARTRSALEAAEPWWLVDRVPTADELLARVTLEESRIHAGGDL
jgi:phosphoglycolate phosphatase-like HAD superfamily hydrolase